MNKYIKQTIELLQSLEEEEILDILLTENKNNPVELISLLHRDKTTIGDLIYKFRPEIVEKYKLLLDNEKKEQDYEW